MRPSDVLLKYEQEAYDYLIRTTPSVDSVVDTPQGPGTVVDVSLLKGMCKVRLDNVPDTPKCFGKRDCRILKDAKGKHESEKNADETLDAESIPEELKDLTKE